jgi:leucyl-tRNA synthetase
VARAADQQTIEARALAAMAKYVAGQAVKRIIIVPGRLINIVV